MVCNSSGGSCSFIPKVYNQFRTRDVLLYWAVELILVVFISDLVGLFLFVTCQKHISSFGLVFCLFHISFLVFIEERMKVNGRVSQQILVRHVQPWLSSHIWKSLNGPPCKRHFRGLFDINFASKNPWRKFYEHCDMVHIGERRFGGHSVQLRRNISETRRWPFSLLNECKILSINITINL